MIIPGFPVPVMGDNGDLIFVGSRSTITNGGTFLSLDPIFGQKIGDLLFFAVSDDFTNATPTPSGWTVLYNTNVSSGHVSLFYKVATSNNETISGNMANSSEGSFLFWALRNAQYIDYTGDAESKTPVPIPCTAGGATCVLLHIQDDIDPVTAPTGYTTTFVTNGGATNQSSLTLGFKPSTYTGTETPGAFGTSVPTSGATMAATAIQLEKL